MPDFLKALEYGAKALRGAVNSVPMPRQSTPVVRCISVSDERSVAKVMEANRLAADRQRFKAPDAAGANSASVMDAPAGSPQPAGAVPTQHIHDILLGIAEAHHDLGALSDAFDWTCVCGHPLPDGDPYAHLRVHVAELQAAAIHNLISK